MLCSVAVFALLFYIVVINCICSSILYYTNTTILHIYIRILIPFNIKKWGRLSVEGTAIGTASKFALPRDDPNAPELYLPVMSFVTYILLCGYTKGIAYSFTPEVLIQTR